jgi:hypothetical protein
MITIIQATALRRKLVQLGYTTLPLFGKVPAMAKWQDVANVSHEMIAMWAKSWVDATNTGVLTRDTPTLDLDILNEQAARACEEFIRDRYEDAGYVLTRIGQPPKRAIPFRTEEPFSKITVNFVGERGEKIEMLASGQQVVVHGDHPETRQPYRWHGGEPWSIAHEDLPYLHPEQAQTLVTDVVKILTTEFRYQLTPSSGLHIGGNGRRSPSATGEDHWRNLLSNIQSGRAMHDSIRNLAAMLMASGMNSGAATHLLQSLVELSEVPHDQRWESRFRDVPRAIDSARKFR